MLERCCYPAQLLGEDSAPETAGPEDDEASCCLRHSLHLCASDLMPYNTPKVTSASHLVTQKPHSGRAVQQRPPGSRGSHHTAKRTSHVESWFFPSPPSCDDECLVQCFFPTPSKVSLSLSLALSLFLSLSLSLPVFCTSFPMSYLNEAPKSRFQKYYSTGS